MSSLSVRILSALVCLALTFGCSEDSSTPTGGGGGNGTPTPETLCAADRTNGDVYTVDPATGQATLLIDTFIDVSKAPENIGRVSSMAYIPQTGAWWLGTGGTATCDGCILTLNPSTGEATVLSQDGGQNHGIGVSGLAVNADSEIYTFCSDCRDEFFQIDPVTGAYTQLDDATGSGNRGNGTTFSSGGQLFVISDEVLYRVDPSDSAVTQIAEVTFSGFPAFQGNSQPIVSMTTRSSDGAVFAIVMDGGGQGNPTSSFLGRVNLTTGEVTHVGQNNVTLVGLAFIPTALIP
jgi:hypothetical protein